MNRMRAWSLGAAGVAVLVLLAGWFLFVSPAKAKVSDLNAQTAAQQTTNSTLQTQIAQLKAQDKDLPAQQAKLAEIRQHLPSTPELPTYIRTLTLMAHRAGVKLVSITPSAPTTVTVAAPVVATPSPTASATASSDSATSDPAVAPATAPVVTSPLRMIPVTLTISGGYYNVIAFLSKVENLKRSMIVYSVGLSEGASGPTVTSSASPSSSGPVANKITAALQTRVFYVVPDTTAIPTSTAAVAPSGAASPATAS
jgi:Tfp pilus assembly protein PilO